MRDRFAKIEHGHSARVALQPGHDGAHRRNRSDRQARGGDVPLFEQSLHLLHTRDGFDGLKILARAIGANWRPAQRA